MDYVERVYSCAATVVRAVWFIFCMCIYNVRDDNIVMFSTRRE